MQCNPCEGEPGSECNTAEAILVSPALRNGFLDCELTNAPSVVTSC